MAVYFARAAGNVNGTIWATTPTGTASNLFPSFTNADTLMANGFVVNLNVNTTVLEVRTDNANSATAGGSFAMNTNGVTLTANVVAGSTSSCVSFALASPNSVSIVGSVTGGSGATTAGAVAHSGSGTLNITGNLVGGSGAGSSAVRSTSSGTINITGNITGGTASATIGVSLVGAGVANVTGNVTGGSANDAAGFAIALAAGEATITGNVTGGSVGIGLIASIGTVTVVGTVTGGSGAVGMSLSGVATGTVTRAKGNGFGNGSSGLTAQVGVNNAASGSTVNVYGVEYGDLGQSPTAGPVILINAASNVATVYRGAGNAKKTLISPDSPQPLTPAISDVRAGVSYEAGNKTGTMAVPPAASVALGVAVGSTTGTAALTPADVWNVLTSNLSVSGSIGERLKNCATVASTAQQIVDALREG